MSGNENTQEAVPKPETAPETTNDIIERQRTLEINKDMTTKEAYFASLAEWAKQAALMQMFPNYLLANYNYPQHMLQTPLPLPMQMPMPMTMPFPAPGSEHLNRLNRQHPAQANNNDVAGAARPNFNRFRVLNEAQQQEIIRGVGGTEMVVAPFWKRAVAEAIDIFILFILKIIVTFSLFHVFDLDFDKDVMRKTLDDDDIFLNFFDISMDFITLSSDLLLIELLTKLIVCCYECLWTVFYNGATPGKSLMKIRILYVEAVLPLQGPVMPQLIFQPQREPFRALLYPAETPSLLRALMRALAKNLVMTLLFPICVVMVFFKNNRTAYDIITKTIVVEANPVPATPPPPPPPPGPVPVPHVPLARPHQQ